MRLGIFGGTFNPIHIGHLRVAEEVRDICGLDKIVFMPSGNPPLKTDDLAGAVHREAMARLATGANINFVVSDIEMRDGDKSYTVNTVEKLRSVYSGDEIFFIMGLDAFLDLPKWLEPDKIISAIDFIIMTRPGFGCDEMKKSPFVEEISIDAAAGVTDCRLKWGRKAMVVQVTGIDVSSRVIRQLVGTGRSIKYLVPEAVGQYIASNKLYTRP
jgi:nicotinate-nucleotide adenylyltransferase